MLTCSHFFYIKCFVVRFLVINYLLLLLLRLAHHPTKHSGRGISLPCSPCVPLGKAAKDIAHFRKLVGIENFTIKMDFKQHSQGKPLLAELIQSGRRKGCIAGPLKSLKTLPDAYIQFDLNSALLHFQPFKVSLDVPLQGLSLNIALFLDYCLSVSLNQLRSEASACCTDCPLVLGLTGQVCQRVKVVYLQLSAN